MSRIRDVPIPVPACGVMSERNGFVDSAKSWDKTDKMHLQQLNYRWDFFGVKGTTGPPPGVEWTVIGGL